MDWSDRRDDCEAESESVVGQNDFSPVAATSSTTSQLSSKACDRIARTPPERPQTLQPASVQCVGDELQQTAIRIAEVDVLSATARSRVSVERPCHDLDSLPAEMLNRLFYPPRPNEAEVAVARLNRLLGIQAGKTGTMDVQLPVAKPVVARCRVPLLTTAPRTLR